MSCWHMGKGRAKVGPAMVNRQRLTGKVAGYNGGNFKDFVTARGGVNPQE
jgi:hypothetical protein